MNNPLKLVALALILAGVLGLLYGGFSYTKQTDVLKVGPIELSVTEKKSVNVPLWAGLAAIAAGAGLLLSIKKN
jgi:LPXTG-motif cell wall-anchored protein